ncbi:MAG: prolyl oligopeptidase family serine peptidase [Saprospiraceae bacterium]|nr:prolyl oligopeptidase family serine peptidase [Saprospiraceae bacterium]
MRYLALYFFSFFFIAANAQKTPFTSEDALNVKSFDYSSMTDDGLWVAGTIRSGMDRKDVDHFRFADPSYVAPYTSELVIINSETGEIRTISPAKSIINAFEFSPDGKKLAYVKYEDDRYRLFLYDLSTDKSKLMDIKDERSISPSNEIYWTKDNTAVIIALRADDWLTIGDSLYREATVGPITVYDGNEPLLKWEKIRYHSSLNEVVKVDIRSAMITDILPESRYDDVNLTENGDTITFIEYNPKKTAYQRKGGTDYGLYAIALDNPSERDTLIAPSEKRINISWDESKTHFAYTDSSHIYVQSIGQSKPTKVSFDTTEISKKDTMDAKFSFMRWRHDGKAVLASSKTGYWLIDIDQNTMNKVYDLPEDPDEAPSRSIIHWSKDGNSWFMAYSARDKWERGMVKYDIDSRTFTDLMLDSNLYSRWRVSKEGNQFFYNFSDGNLPNDLYVSDPGFEGTKQLTDLNPWISTRKITRTELVKYRDVDGNELNGVLYYPVDYEEGKKYPLVCELYETFFNNGYRPSMNMVANAGYFGFRPSVSLEEGYPGEAWIKGVTSGINKLIDMGLVDEKKLGVHGVSYGGYATSLLISQTDRFAAAINISGKTNIISFLGDSPKIGTRNYAAAEVGQDRIGVSLWEAPLKYINTSAVMFADRIKTPHLLLTGEGDWNVTALNTRELYYAMRRLGKDVVWVNYQKAGHGAGYNGSATDYHDQWKRMLEWYKKYFDKADEE